MKNFKDWIEVTNSEEILTHYKQDSPLYSVRMESILKKPMLDIISIFYEVGNQNIFIFNIF